MELGLPTRLDGMADQKAQLRLPLVVLGTRMLGAGILAPGRILNAMLLVAWEQGRFRESTLRLDPCR